MNTNLLDLNNDILNVIGDYVKNDNADRMKKLIKENFKQVDISYNILKRIGQVKKNFFRRLIVNYFHLLNIKDFKIIDEYLTLKRNLI